MAFGFLNLPKAKWWAALRQVILKSDFEDIETALLEAHGLIKPPTLTYVDATAVKVIATANCPAAVLMSGIPNILHPEAFISGGLSDGKYRVNVADTTMDFDVAASLWGTEQVSQWYVILAKAANADAVFTLKAMPILTVKSQATQTIKTGRNTAPATGINYAFTDHEFIDGVLYFLSGASKGLIRTITENVVDTDTAITYSGAALSVAAGDWFIVLPPGTNFRWLGDIYNGSGGDLGIGDLFFNNGEVLVEARDVAAQTNTFPGLAPGKYRLKYELALANVGNDVRIRFNADTNNYHGVTLIAAPGVGVSVLPTSTDYIISVSASGSLNTKGMVEFETFYGNNKKVDISGHSHCSAVMNITTGDYNGGNDLTSVSVYTADTSLTGRIWLWRLG